MSRIKPWMATTTVALTVGAITLAIGVVLGTAADDGVPSAPSDVTVEGTGPDAAFFAEVSAWSDLEQRTSRAYLVDTGYDICARIGTPGLSRQGLSTEIMTAGWTPTDTTWLLMAAERNLCPGKAYAQDAVPTVAVPTPAAETSGPASEIASDGTFEVGVDIVAGKWKADGVASGKCYWKRMAPVTREIIENHYAEGGDVVWIKEGELFQVSECGRWSVQP